MTDDITPYQQPQENATKEMIDNLLKDYIQQKGVFFMNAKSSDMNEQQKADISLTALIKLIHYLLELSKPDNVGLVEEINYIQDLVEEIGRQPYIDDDVVAALRQVCDRIDCGPLRPYMKTQPNIAPCVYRDTNTAQGDMPTK